MIAYFERFLVQVVELPVSVITQHEFVMPAAYHDTPVQLAERGTPGKRR